MKAEYRRYAPSVSICVFNAEHKCACRRSLFYFLSQSVLFAVSLVSSSLFCRGKTEKSTSLLLRADWPEPCIPTSCSSCSSLCSWITPWGGFNYSVPWILSGKGMWRPIRRTRRVARGWASYEEIGVTGVSSIPMSWSFQVLCMQRPVAWLRRGATCKRGDFPIFWAWLDVTSQLVALQLVKSGVIVRQERNSWCQPANHCIYRISAFH